MKRKAFALVLLALSACSGPEVSKDGDEVLKDVPIPGQETPRLVLYGSSTNKDCLAYAERVSEVSNAPEEASTVEDFSTRLTIGRLSTYRAYFLPSQFDGPTDAAFVFCPGAEVGMPPIRCVLIGVTPKGCFEAGIYGIANAPGIETAVESIRENWPEELAAQR